MSYPRRAPRLAFSGTKPALVIGEMYQTTRVGDKWIANHIDGKDEVVLIGPDGRPFGLARITAVFYLPLMVIPQEWLLYNYDPAYHTLAGTLAGLVATYSTCEKEERRQEVHPDTVVSLVFFKVEELK